MGRTPLPHHKTLDQIQLNALPIAHELPVVQSLVKWVQKTIQGSEPDRPRGWMLLTRESMSYSEQLEKIIRLNESVVEQKRCVRELFVNVGNFARKHKKIEKAIFALNAAIREIPPIEPEIHLLKTKTSLFDEPEVLSSLVDYTEKTGIMLKRVNELKQITLNELLNALSPGNQRLT